jgi:hypothetical protein
MTAAKYYTVPPGEEYNNYEKLIFPFDDDTWKLITFTFVAAFVTIFILNFTSVKLRNFVFGPNVPSPSLNVAAHFFKIGQTIMPGKSFARFLVMSYILYCLIIRTAWQSKMFEFLQKEMRKPEVQSLEELAERNFTVVLIRETATNLEYALKKQLTESKFTVVETRDTNTSREYLYQKLYVPSSKFAFIVDSRSFHRASFHTRGAFRERIHHDAQLTEITCGMRFQANDKLYVSFNKVIQKLNEAGIINHLIDKYEKYLDPKYYEKPVMAHKQYLKTTYSNSFEDGPQVLTLSDLEFGFVIWLGALVLPLIGFIFECCIKPEKKIAKTFRCDDNLDVTSFSRSVPIAAEPSQVELSELEVENCEEEGEQKEEKIQEKEGEKEADTSETITQEIEPKPAINDEKETKVACKIQIEEVENVETEELIEDFITIEDEREKARSESLEHGLELKIAWD